jgi:hypothetical protein
MMTKLETRENIVGLMYLEDASIYDGYRREGCFDAKEEESG